jgi:hypothetical protein
LNYFNRFRVNQAELLEIFKTDKLWEKLIDSMHLMSLNQLKNLLYVVNSYEIEYARIWILIQTFIKRNVSLKLADYKDNKDSLKGVESNIDELIRLYDSLSIALKENALFSFKVYLKKLKDELIVKNSYNI